MQLFTPANLMAMFQMALSHNGPMAYVLTVTLCLVLMIHALGIKWPRSWK